MFVNITLFMMISIMVVCNLALANEGSLDVNAEIYVTDSHELVIELVNLTGKSLTFPANFLSRESMVLVLVEDSPFGDTLDEISWFSPSLEGTAILSPNETVKTTLNLKNSFPKFSSTLKQKGILLFWDLRVSSLDRLKVSERFGGVIRIDSERPKEKSILKTEDMQLY